MSLGFDYESQTVWRALVSFLVAVKKYPDKSNLRENGFILAHSSWVQSTVTGMSMGQKLEAAGHITSTIRKQRMMKTCIPLFLLFYSAQ